MLACALLGVMVAGQAMAANIRYMNSGDYLEPTGWQGGVIPGTNDTARFNWGNNTVTLAGEAPLLRNFQIGVDESGQLVVESGGKLNTTGTQNSTVGNNPNAGIIGRLTVNAGGEVNVTNSEESSEQDTLYQEAARDYGAALDRLTRAYEARPEKRTDLLQEIHIALWRSMASFNGRCSMRTWASVSTNTTSNCSAKTSATNAGPTIFAPSDRRRTCWWDRIPEQSVSGCKHSSTEYRRAVRKLKENRS